LKKIIKGGKLTGKVKLQFGNDYPLRVDYLVQDKLNLGFILAPRVAND
jgi:DNA polymerase III sliding clamp (beta) subunit (PCNA family)